MNFVVVVSPLTSVTLENRVSVSTGFPSGLASSPQLPRLFVNVSASLFVPLVLDFLYTCMA